jgi:hypothetical protein
VLKARHGAASAEHGEPGVRENLGLLNAVWADIKLHATSAHPNLLDFTR